MKAKYVSVWDGGIEIRTDCEFDPFTNIVSNIETSDVEGLEYLEDEYIELYDGTEIRDFYNEDDEEDWRFVNMADNCQHSDDIQDTSPYESPDPEWDTIDQY